MCACGSFDVASVSFFSNSFDGKSVCMLCSCLFAACAYSAAEAAKPPSTEPTPPSTPAAAEVAPPSLPRSEANLKSSSLNPFLESSEPNPFLSPSPPAKLDDPDHNARILANWRAHIQEARELFAKLACKLGLPGEKALPCKEACAKCIEANGN